MIESVLILDSTTKIAIKRVSIDTDRPETLNLLPGEMLSTRHDGDLGWFLTEAGEWIDPNPPASYPQDQRVRNQRNNLLDQTDRYMIPDFPITEELREQWKQYRQALRDITAQPGFPSDITWPESPK